MKRRINIASLQQKTFDLLIVGGGITGAGIFQEATRRGYRCLLLEKGDFASGTSSKTAKLIHGGIRYLKYGKLGLIKESLEERNYLLKTYPHLVKPLSFLFPVYDLPVKYRVGMAMYHFLDNQKSLPDYRYLEKDEVIEKFPFINQKNLRAGFIYYDAVTSDARLCSEVIHTAACRSSSAALNYCELTAAISEGKEPVVVNCRDHLTRQPLQFKARYIANATGVWTDEVLKKLTGEESAVTAPSKGIHVVISKKRFPTETALVIPSYANDGRANYALPWENDTVLFGTTDTEYAGALNSPAADVEDIHYLLHSIQRFAPSLGITAADILFVYAGLRPLFREEKSTYARSRDYQIWWSREKLLNIYGGKFTSFHSMANSFLDEFQTKASKPAAQPLVRQSPAALPAGLPARFAQRIKTAYADESSKIFSIVSEYESYAELFSENLEITVAELIYFIRFQQCYHLDDLLTRRLPLTYCINGLPDKETVISKAAEVMKAECGWTQNEYKTEIKEYESRLHPAW